jgi:hypothetical protein
MLCIRIVGLKTILSSNVQESYHNFESYYHLFSDYYFFFFCNGVDSQFGIKCGGPEITSSNRVLFERDNTSLAAASYYVSDTSTFGVSNTGYFSGSNDPQYTTSSSSQFTNTLDSELFQTSRLSASSLRYYGLGLENGNYTITIQFTESVIFQGSTWKSLGRRVFDVYIQVCIAALNVYYYDNKHNK